MPNSRHKLGSTQGEADAKERELDTIREINKVLDHNPVDLAQLRKLSAVRGLVNSQIRAKVWPLLLGVSKTADSYEEHKAGHHRDSSVVDVDVQRSLWAWTAGWTDAQREDKRKDLQFVLDATVCSQDGTIFYYQGLHDVASVLLLTMGDKAAYETLTHLSLCQLRDCTRSTLDAVLELLNLLMPILQKADEEVHDQLAAAEVQPFFALGWFITWFAHSVDNLQHVCRLFDLFMVSHPLMPLYVTAVVIKIVGLSAGLLLAKLHQFPGQTGVSALLSALAHFTQAPQQKNIQEKDRTVVMVQGARKQVLACELDPAELHRLLTNLPVLGQLCADDLCQEATILLKQHPPDKLAAKAHLNFMCSTAAAAEIRDEHWYVADQPKASGTVTRSPLRYLPYFQYKPPKPTKIGLATAAVAVVAVAAAFYSQGQLAAQLANFSI